MFAECLLVHHHGNARPPHTTRSVQSILSHLGILGLTGHASVPIRAYSSLCLCPHDLSQQLHRGSAQFLYEAAPGDAHNNALLQSRSPRAPPASLRSASCDRSYWQNPASVKSPPAWAPCVAPPTFTGGSRDSESPHLTTQRVVNPAAEYKDHRWRGTRENEPEVITSPSEDAPKRDGK